MWKTNIATAVVLCFAQNACADNPPPPNLQIVGEEVLAGSQSSCWVTLRINNTGISDNLSGWQLVCQVVPLGGTIGTASITNFATPGEYVFSSSGIMGISWVNVPEFGDIFFDEAGNPSTGEEVTESGKNLLQIELTSLDMDGLFGIVVIPDDGTGTYSNWVPPGLGPNNFDIVIIPDWPEEVVASVNFGSIPEPPSGFVLISGAVVLLWIAYRRHKLSSVPPCSTSPPL